MSKHVLKTGKQLLTSMVASTTIMWSVGLGAFAPLASAASFNPGDLLQVKGEKAVYYVADDGERLTFLNEGSFASWYGKDFSKLKKISKAELESVPAKFGTAMTYRPGTKLMKIQSDPKTYAIEPGGVVRWVPSEELAKKLYGGDNWWKNVETVGELFFAFHKKGADVTLAKPPIGLTLKDAAGKMYLIDTDGKREITDAGMTANTLMKDYLRTTDAATLSALPVSAKAVLSAKEDASSKPQFAPLSAAPAQQEAAKAADKVVTPTTGKALTVALAADNPSGGTHASGTSYNKALALSLSAGADGAVSVTSLTLAREGFAADNALSGVAVFSSATKRHGNFVTFSDGKATLTLTSDPVTVPAGQTITLWVKTNITATTGTYQLALSAASAIGTTATTVTGAFPLKGGLFSLTNGANSVGAMTVDAFLVHNNGANDVNAVNINLGTTNQEISRFRFVETSSREDVSVKRITLYNNGNASDGDLTNIGLYGPDGKLLVSAGKTVDRWATFDMSAAPYVITKGNTRDLSVRADITGGSTRTARFVIQNDYDIELMGVTTSSGILATAATTVDGAFPIGDSSGGAASCAAGVTCINRITINSGSLTLSKAGDSPSGNISAGSNDIILGKWILAPQGEDMELRRLDFVLTYGTAPNGTLKLNLDNQNVFSLASASLAATTVNNVGNLSTFPIVKSGKPATITLVASIASTTASGQTFLASLDAVQVKRLSTNDLVDPAVAAANANTLTVAAASLQVSKNSSYPDTTIVAGLSNAKVGSFNFAAGSTADVNVSSLTVALAGDLTNASSLMLKSGDTQLGSTISTPTAANAISISGFSVPKGSSKTIDVYVNSNSNTVGPTSASITAASGTAADSGASITATGVTATGQTITWTGNGTLTISIDSTNTPTQQIMHSNEVDTPLLALRLTANNAEDIRVTNIQLSASNGMTNWKDLKLFTNTTQLGSTTQLINGAALFGGLSYVVPKDTTVTLWVKGSANASGTLNSQSMANLALDYIEAIGVSGGSTVKPGTALTTNWTATNAVKVGGAITVASTAGFHVGDLVLVHDTTNGAQLGIVTGEPTTTTALTLALRANLAHGGGAAGTAVVMKLSSGATTAASAGTPLRVGAAITVTSTKGFNTGDAVVAYGPTGPELGYLSAITNATSLTVRTISDGNTGVVTRVSKLGTDTLSTGITAATALLTTATATTVTSNTGFQVGDMVLVQENSAGGGVNGSFGMVTAINTNGTGITLALNAAVALSSATAGTLVRVGGANPTTIMATTVGTAGARVIAGQATTVTSTTGFGVGDAVLTIGLAATGIATLGWVQAVTNATTMTIRSAAADANAVGRATRLPAANAAGNAFTLHDVEPTIKTNDTIAPGGNSNGGSGQIVGAFDIKADGDRNMDITSLNTRIGGSNFPHNFVTSYELFNGASRIATNTTLSAAVTQDVSANATTGATITLCFSGGADEVDAAGELSMGAVAGIAAVNNRIAVNDTLVLFVSTTNYRTFTVTAKNAAADCGNGENNDIALTVTNSSLVGAAITSNTAGITVQNFNVIFDANSATPLATQSITAGSTLTLTVKADTTNVKSGITQGTVNYNATINGTTGAASTGGLTWGYTPSGGTALAGMNSSDSYPVNGKTLVY